MAQKRVQQDVFAMKVQASVRRWLAARKVAKLRRDRVELRAASLMQALARGWHARRACRKRRVQREKASALEIHRQLK